MSLIITRLVAAPSVQATDLIEELGQLGQLIAADRSELANGVSVAKLKALADTLPEGDIKKFFLNGVIRDAFETLPVEARAKGKKPRDLAEIYQEQVSAPKRMVKEFIPLESFEQAFQSVSARLESATSMEDGTVNLGQLYSDRPITYSNTWSMADLLMEVALRGHQPANEWLNKAEYASTFANRLKRYSADVRDLAHKHAETETGANAIYLLAHLLRAQDLENQKGYASFDVKDTEKVLESAEKSSRFEQMLGLAKGVGHNNLSDTEILSVVNARTGQAFKALNEFIEHAGNQRFSRAPDAVLSDIV